MGAGREPINRKRRRTFADAELGSGGAGGRRRSVRVGAGGRPGGGRRRWAPIGPAGAPPRGAGPVRKEKWHRPAAAGGGDFSDPGNMAEYTRLQNSLALIRLRNPPVNAIR